VFSTAAHKYSQGLFSKIKNKGFGWNILKFECLSSICLNALFNLCKPQCSYF
jgi:hypothetical protein